MLVEPVYDDYVARYITKHYSLQHSVMFMYYFMSLHENVYRKTINERQDDIQLANLIEWMYAQLDN